MNSTKFQRIKEEIMMADKICSDISIHSILKKAEYIIQSDIPEDEIRKFYNRFGEQLSLACEHYLKAMIIPRMHYEGISNESEEELNRIFDNRDNHGIAKKYSHYFDKLLTSDNTALEESDGLQESILIRLAERLGIQEFGEYRSKQLSSWINDGETGISDVRGELLNKIKEKVDANRGSYPESRYGMFTEYIADLVFLTNLCLTLQEYPTKTINNCLFINGLEMHIFPADDSEICEKRSDGTNITYLFTRNNKMEIIECNGIRKQDLSQYQQFNDLFPGIVQKHDTIEISYIEKGKNDINLPVIIKYDQLLNCFCKSNSNTLQNEKLVSK